MQCAHAQQAFNNKLSQWLSFRLENFIIIIRRMEIIPNGKKFIILLFTLIYSSLGLNVNINLPFLLGDQSSKITTLDNDLENCFLVGFLDGQAKRFTSDFSSYTSLAIPEPVDKFFSSRIQLNNIQLSNGTVWTMLNNMTITLSNSYTTLRVYTYPAFTQIHVFTFSETILKYRGFPIYTPSTMNPLHVLVFNQTIKVVYKGITSTAFSLVSYFGPNKYCTAVTPVGQTITKTGDFISISFPFYETVNGLGLIRINIEILLTYNYTSRTYDVTSSSSYHLMSVFNFFVTKIVTANGLIVMQVQGGSILLYCNGQTSFSSFSDLLIAKNPIIQLFYVNGTFNILYSSGLIQFNVAPNSITYRGSTLISSLPNNTYIYLSGSAFNVLYVPLGPYIYKTQCQANYYDDGHGNCIEYQNCKVPNCLQCSLTIDTCGTCVDGYYRNDNFTCTLTPSPASSPNSPDAPAPAPAMNETALNSSYSYNQPVFAILISLLQLEDLFWLFFNASKTVISVPSTRSMAPLFYYFGNFDDLYLYMFHDRLYGPTLNTLFSEINSIEMHKWSVINYRTELSWFGVKNESFYAVTNFQEGYLTYQYTTPERQGQGSEGLLVNCVNFFLVGIPLSAVTYLLLQACFRLLFRFPVSRFLRKFSLWGYFFIILFDGNVQQFAFYLAAQWRNIFAFAFQDNCLKAGIIFFGFILVLASVGGFLVTFGAYKRLNQYLTENNYNTLTGNVCLCLQNGFRSFILGILHSVLRPLPYTTMLAILIGTELLFFAIFIISISLRTYKIMNYIWTYIILTFIRILLILTFFFDNPLAESHLIETIQCAIITLMIIIYFIGTLIAVLTAVVQFLKLIVKIIKWPSNQPNCPPCQLITKPTFSIYPIRPKRIGNAIWTLQKTKPKNLKVKKIQTVLNYPHEKWHIIELEEQRH